MSAKGATRALSREGVHATRGGAGASAPSGAENLNPVRFFVKKKRKQRTTNAKATPMARRGPQHELLQLLLQGGEQGTSEERLEQLYREVAPQVRQC